MKCIILMFSGGLVGGMIGPVAALAGASAGFLIGRHILVAFPKTLSCAQTDDCRPGMHE